MTLDARSLMAAVKANLGALEGCPGHRFERIAPGQIFSKYRCAVCGGTADLDFKTGYEQGLQHGKTSAGAV
ncbi:hypothetical protein J2847_006434 [Azospirillum agricola]|uniref:hypothetical protein n=1 Tax=Azospirillum agricola TaxID=1720247 RepID=UPI001AE6CA58|nr:hypothetical protein [Azospirillum agricola]MBP2233099.1 hypothetical protein [Azospirillum agricola]